MLYEICPICRGSGVCDPPPKQKASEFNTDSCIACGGKRYLEVGLTLKQFEHKLEIAADAELLLSAVSSGKCYMDHSDQECVLMFHGGPRHERERNVGLPLSKSLRERLIKLTAKEGT